ncbi:MAG: hypothetical protein HY001_00395 [Candidatus Portnoybacteria bacterium]|nr:hypothetical protein [Candidatus Portnoybacteria bacterium]
MAKISKGKIKKIGNWVAAILLGNTKEIIARIDERTEHILKDIDEMKPKVNDMSPKVDILWKERLASHNSPSQLNKRGKEILTKSGIKEIIDRLPAQLIEEIKEKKPQNAYQVQEFAREVMFTVQNSPEILKELQENAYRIGTDIDSILFVGSIYLRDIALKKLNFNIQDLDKK